MLTHVVASKPAALVCLGFASAACFPGCASQLSAASTASTVPMSAEVAALLPTAKRIIATVQSGNQAWQKIEHLTLRIGPRLSGSPGLDAAIAWAADTMRKDGHENIRVEPVMVPHWERGSESLTMVTPGKRDLPVLGLGGTVSTPPEGVTAEVEVIRSEADLQKLGPAAKGKFLLIDTAMAPHDPVHQRSGYGATVKFRYAGPGWADKYGAVGVLMRSLTATSLATPHTGGTSYHGVGRKVPAVAVTTEDSAAMARMRELGVKVTLQLRTGGKHYGWAPSGNVVAEYVGRERPDEVVIISGHLDAWDVGHGAHDDASGCVMAMEALNVLRKLKLRPRRTIRVVLWTNEENGLRGARDYAFQHETELPYHVAGLEADSGSWKPLGYRVEHKDASVAEKTVLPKVLQLVQLSRGVDAHRAKVSFSGADVKAALFEAGVPVLGHWMDTRKYFDIHHTQADTLDKLDPKELTDNVATMAVMAYALAEIPGRIDGQTPALVPRDNGAVNRLQWLAGDWHHATSRLVWTRPRNGLMIGLGFPTRRGDAKRVRFSRMRLDAAGDGLRLSISAGPPPSTLMHLKSVKITKNVARFKAIEADSAVSNIELRRDGDALTVVFSGSASETMVFQRSEDADALGWLGR